jgi:cytochrome P450
VTAVSDVDVFDDAVLADPFPAFRRLRDAGPVVWMRRHGMWALPRYAEVRAVLRDWETFSSASGVGMTDEVNNRPPALLTSDPPLHTRRRKVPQGELSTRALRPVEQELRERADELVDRLVADGTFDAVGDLAQPYVVSVVADLVGLPEERRSHLLAGSNAGFNRFGPANRHYLDAELAFRRLLDYVQTVAVPGRLAPDGMGARLYAAAGHGHLHLRECASMMLVYVWPSMDTTIAAIASMVRRFALHPDQWDLVREDPGLIPAAFNETLRIDTPVRLFTRVTTREVPMDGLRLPAGTRILVMMGSANRDERRYPDPDRFDVRRNPTDHLAFGHGVHHCVGAPLARLEAGAVIGALARRVSRLTLLDERRHLNNVIHCPGRLAVRAVSR